MEIDAVGGKILVHLQEQSQNLRKRCGRCYRNFIVVGVNATRLEFDFYNDRFAIALGNLCSLLVGFGCGAGMIIVIRGFIDVIVGGVFFFRIVCFVYIRFYSSKSKSKGTWQVSTYH